jgi:hypothetical protein
LWECPPTGGTIVLTALFLAGRVAPLVGTPSFTLLAESDKLGATPLGPAIEEELCQQHVLFVASWAKQGPTHEGVLAYALEKHDADVILDATLRGC